MNIKQILNNEQYIGKELTVSGWITTERDQKNLVFISLNDGSCFTSLQIVVELNDEQREIYNSKINRLTRGVSLTVSGRIIESPAKGQKVEMNAQIGAIEILGDIDTEIYPMSKKRHSPEFLRQFPHLRVRTNMGGLMARVRNSCSKATHDFFQDRGFIYVHTPLLTSNDCEGAGETFLVTLDGKKSDSFFGKNVNLTVSGQLHVESYAMAFTNVYTFGPTFRAEKSNTSRHLSEFWMIEPEMVFIEFNDLMDIAEKYLKYCIKYVLDNNKDDMQFVNRFVSKKRIEMLEQILETPFKKISYTEAIEVLMKDYTKKRGYDKVEKWGIDMNSEQEKYLTKKFGPVIVYDYPKEIKSFYMKENKDGITVQAMDILVPNIGEIIGGSMRENNFDVLKSKMEEKGIEEGLDWYLDLRRYGGAEHGGFGLGFERLIMLITGINNIKDTIPFPRYFKHCIY